MGALMSRHKTRWLAPSPFWEAQGSSILGSGPALLRFDTDDFMDELMDVLTRDPKSLRQWRARPETWREPLPRPAATLSPKPLDTPLRLKIPRELARATPPTTNAIAAEPNEDSGPLKLYQAAHQRYYLVAASLAKLTKGLADRCVEPARRESAGFVVRRLVPKPNVEASAVPDEATWQELAFVRGPRGYHWRTLASDARTQIADTEQINPLFGVSYRSNDQRRKIFAGLVPIAKRETYLGAPPESPTKEPPATVTNMADPRLARLRADVIEPWRSLVEQAEFAATQEADWISNHPELSDAVTAPSPAPIPALQKDLFEQIQTGSWYVARDLLAFVSDNLPAVYDAIGGDNTSLDALPADFRAANQAVLDWLSSVSAGSYFIPFNPDAYGYSPSLNLRAFLAALVPVVDLVDPTRDHLERVDVPFRVSPRDPDWPTAIFPLANPTALNGAGPLPAGTFASPADAIESLEVLVKAAMSAASDEQYAMQIALPHELDSAEGWFWIRCVFESRNCEPFFGPTISDPTEPFQMAPFFDPDAPARPIRIPMPMDISPAGLRKFSKNASFVISDMLCSKIKSIRKLTLGDLVLSVLPWPFHKDLPTVEKPGPCIDDPTGVNFGMICSLSIPIVTLCAMILMFIMVLLFDYVFRWVPYLLMCFPVPGLKAKKGT